MTTTDSQTYFWQEFHPYVFQIFAQLIELHPGALPAFYMSSLFQPLLAPLFWERPGNVPALTRLMQVLIPLLLGRMSVALMPSLVRAEAFIGAISVACSSALAKYCLFAVHRADKCWISWQAYLAKAAAQIVSANQLQGLLGVFQKLIASKALDHEGFKLLDSMMIYARLQGLQQYLPTVGGQCAAAVLTSKR